MGPPERRCEKPCVLKPLLREVGGGSRFGGHPFHMGKCPQLSTVNPGLCARLQGPGHRLDRLQGCLAFGLGLCLQAVNWSELGKETGDFMTNQQLGACTGLSTHRS